MKKANGMPANFGRREDPTSICDDIERDIDEVRAMLARVGPDSNKDYLNEATDNLEQAYTQIMNALGALEEALGEE